MNIIFDANLNDNDNNEWHCGDMGCDLCGIFDEYEYETEWAE